MSALTPLKSSGRMSQVHPGSIPDAKIDALPSEQAALNRFDKSSGIEGG